MKRLFFLLLFAGAACSTQSNRPAAPTQMKVGSYSSEAEASPVGVIPTALLHDAQRNKDVDIAIDYPTRGGPFPIIIFSHGYGSTNHGYEPLVSYWASNGYVCIRPAHADAGALRQATRDITAMVPEQPQRRRQPRTQQQTQAAQPPPPNPEEQVWDKEREPQWRDRAADIRLVIDSLGELERRFPELQGKMDPAKIGVGGHSYGAFTAMLVGGMRTFGNPPLQAADPRVRAVVAMSPQGIAANRGTTAQSWADMHLPALFMTGTNDRGLTESEDANWRKQAFENSPAGEKYFVLIEGASHFSFTGATNFPLFEEPRRMPASTNPYGSQTSTQPQTGPALIPGRHIFDVIKITSLAFWDATLKDNKAAHDLLQPAKYDDSFSGATMTAK